ncbi:MAG: Ig-like domain-containing protein [Clostridia bacterium]
MKKTLASVLVALMFVTLFAGISFAEPEQAKAVMTALDSDTFGIKLGDTKTVTFTTEIASSRALSANDVKLVDENNTVIASLNDEGVNGDSVKGDGTYTASVEMTADTRTTKTYRATVGGAATSEFEIRYYKEITDTDTAALNAMWDRVEDYEKELESFKMTDSEILNKVNEYLENDPEITNITRETDFSIHFEMGEAHIPCAFVRTGADKKGGNAINPIKETLPTQIKAGSEELFYPSSPDIAVYCPYYGYDGSFSYNYRDRAETLPPVTGGQLYTYYGDQGSVENFKKFGEYGVIMVDSHGDMSNGKSWICIPVPGPYDNADISEGHMISMGGGGVQITGTFFKKYCETMPGTVVYLGTCLGMATDGLCAPMVEIGANFVTGYDKSVTFRYDGIMMDSIFTYLATENVEKNRLYTTEEAFTNAKNDNGQVDTWGDAVLQFAGHGATVIMTEPVYVTDVSLKPDSADLYVNNTKGFTPLINPADANKYEFVFSTENENIAVVDENGIVTARKEGTTNLVCTVTDHLEDGTTATFIAKAAINVLGIMPVAEIELEKSVFEVNMGSSGMTIAANIAPENASNQNVLWESKNTAVATVDKNGVIIPVSVGTTLILATSEDGNFKDAAVCIVNESDFDAAANATGGKLAFINDAEDPFVKDITTDADRASVVSTNHDNGSRAVLMLNLGLLPENTVIKFDWKINSEPKYDKMVFKINDSEVGIDSISGEQDWATCTYTIRSSREAVLTWTYRKDSTTSVGLDSAWLDNVDVIIPNATHTVKFIANPAEPENVLGEVTVNHGEAPVVPDAPFIPGNTFIDWSGILDAVRSDMTVYPVYYEGRLDPSEIFMVTFLDWDGTELSKAEVEAGTAATAPNPPIHENYCFIGWDVDFSCVISDLTVTAQYLPIGDVNHDKVINSGDASYILCVLANLIEPDEYYAIIGDVNHDTEVNSGDAATILLTLTDLS